MNHVVRMLEITDCIYISVHGCTVHKHIDVGRGVGIYKFQQKIAVLLISSGRNLISPLLAPVEKPWEKSTSGLPWKTSFRRPCTQACKMTQFL